MTREYTLYLQAGAKGFPGKWSPEWDDSEQIKGAEYFQSEQPTQKESKTTMTVQPIKFSTLAELASGSNIVCIQGKITDIFDPNRGEGNYGPWVIQNATISDGTLKHDIAFMDAEHVLPKSVKGKTIRVTAQEYKSKLKGLELKEKEVKGKPKRSVNVKFPAKIEILNGDSWVEHVPAEEGASESGGQPATQPAQSYRQPEQSHAVQSTDASLDTVEDRVANYFKVFGVVCDAAGHDTATELEALSHSDLKEITTGICMSFKGQYGVYAPPVFAGEIQPGKSSPPRAGETDSQTQTTSGEEDEASAPLGWRNAEHKGVKLGDYEEDKLSELIQWAIDNPSPKSETGRLLQPQLMLADTELRSPASKKVSKALAAAGMGSEFEEEDVEAVCNEEFGDSFSDLRYPSLFALGNSLAEYVTKMKAAFTARQPKPAAGPKKIAKKPAAASVEDDDDDSMPS